MTNQSITSQMKVEIVWTKIGTHLGEPDLKGKVFDYEVRTFKANDDKCWTVRVNEFGGRGKSFATKGIESEVAAKEYATNAIASDIERRLERANADLQLLSASPSVTDASTIIKYLKDKVEDFDREYGRTDWETGAFEFSSNAQEEYSNSMHELIEEIEQLSPPQPTDRTHQLEEQVKELQKESLWIRNKLGLAEDVKLLSGDITLAGKMHNIVAHANGYVKYVEAYKCDDKQGEIARQSVQISTLLDALKDVVGDHWAPNDCYATGPKTGNEYHDLVRCPSCCAMALIAAIEKGKV